MNEYIYKGFKISYDINKETEKNLFKADGAAACLLTKSQPLDPVKFHTEYDTYQGAEHEIKKLLENYVDFELKNFYDMKSEKIQSP